MAINESNLNSIIYLKLPNMRGSKKEFIAEAFKFYRINRIEPNKHSSEGLFNIYFSKLYCKDSKLWYTNFTS